jgi:hypothetical protein
MLQSIQILRIKMASTDPRLARVLLQYRAYLVAVNRTGSRDKTVHKRTFATRVHKRTLAVTCFISVREMCHAGGAMFRTEHMFPILTNLSLAFSQLHS